MQGFVFREWKKLSQKAKFQFEINRLATELKIACELNDEMRKAIHQKDRDHELVLNEARRRTIPLNNTGLELNFLPEHIVSVESEMETPSFRSQFSPSVRDYVAGPVTITVKVYGTAILQQLTPKEGNPLLRPRRTTRERSRLG